MLYFRVPTAAHISQQEMTWYKEQGETPGTAKELRVIYSIYLNRIMSTFLLHPTCLFLDKDKIKNTLTGGWGKTEEEMSCFWI